MEYKERLSLLIESIKKLPSEKAFEFELNKLNSKINNDFMRSAEMVIDTLEDTYLNKVRGESYVEVRRASESNNTAHIYFKNIIKVKAKQNIDFREIQEIKKVINRKQKSILDSFSSICERNLKTLNNEYSMTYKRDKSDEEFKFYAFKDDGSMYTTVSYDIYFNISKKEINYSGPSYSFRKIVKDNNPTKEKVIKSVKRALENFEKQNNTVVNFSLFNYISDSVYFGLYFYVKLPEWRKLDIKSAEKALNKLFPYAKTIKFEEYNAGFFISLEY